MYCLRLLPHFLRNAALQILSCFLHWQSEFVGKNMRKFGCVLDLYQGECWLACLLPSFLLLSLPCSLSRFISFRYEGVWDSSALRQRYTIGLAKKFFQVFLYQLPEESEWTFGQPNTCGQPGKVLSVAGKNLNYFTLIVNTPPPPHTHTSSPVSPIPKISWWLQRKQWFSEKGVVQMTVSLC